MTSTGWKARDLRVIAGMEADYIAHAHRKLYEGIAIPKIVQYLAYANVALNEKRADLGLLDRCSGCKVPITGAPVFDETEDYRTLVPARWKRWCCESCRAASRRAS